MSNMEIEIRVKIKRSANALLNWLSSKAEFISHNTQRDVYYDQIKESFLYVSADGTKRVDKWLRIRYSEDKPVLCFKLVHRDDCGNYRYCDEYETTIDDAEVMDQILSLNYRELCTVSKERSLWKYDNYFICIDRVAQLGDFVEIELIDSTKTDINIETEKENMIMFIKNISDSAIDNIKIGYPQLLLESEEST